jgi:hypothetical protein
MNLAGALVCEGILDGNYDALLTATFDRDLGSLRGVWDLGFCDHFDRAGKSDGRCSSHDLSSAISVG